MFVFLSSMWNVVHRRVIPSSRHCPSIIVLSLKYACSFSITDGRVYSLLSMKKSPLSAKLLPLTRSFHDVVLKIFSKSDIACCLVISISLQFSRYLDMLFISNTAATAHPLNAIVYATHLVIVNLLKASA